MWNTDVYAPHVPEIEALYQSIPLLLHVHDGASCAFFSITRTDHLRYAIPQRSLLH